MTGVSFSVLATTYGFGTLTEMGPGFFPLFTSLALTSLGAGAVLRAILQTAEPDHSSRRKLAPVIIVLAAVLAFACLLDRAGLVPAVLALLLISQAPRWRSRPVEVLLLSATLTVAIAALFVYGLNLPFRLFRVPMF